MRLRDVMTALPAVVSPRDTPEEAERPTAAAHARPLPLLREGGIPEVLRTRADGLGPPGRDEPGRDGRRTGIEAQVRPGDC
jgi:hypothetical protein